ncbi:tryptophan synthase subunit beta like protein [Halomonas sp. TRM85114]|uniref:tryptophan synthase subunit beta like protein n=1 Tax=Halomonas jincaotanensis TaxID=2810616 RepID=UPI001BD268BB|nr:tryptophan synthase subunit beta like protein [Halomonas jincaotanensis]MBS9402404.1 tryptophan synthase subunit beta like protein [Halomonas jincaotanensis]
MYVKRDDIGAIELISREVTPDCNEFLPADSTEILEFLMENGNAEEAVHLQTSDLAFVRVLEDVIELLMDKGVISFTDLPEPAREKMKERQSIRRTINGSSPMSDSDEEGVI